MFSGLSAGFEFAVTLDNLTHTLRSSCTWGVPNSLSMFMAPVRLDRGRNTLGTFRGFPVLALFNGAP